MISLSRQNQLRMEDQDQTKVQTGVLTKVQTGVDRPKINSGIKIISNGAMDLHLDGANPHKINGINREADGISHSLETGINHLSSKLDGINKADHGTNNYLNNKVGIRANNSSNGVNNRSKVGVSNKPNNNLLRHRHSQDSHQLQQTLQVLLSQHKQQQIQRKVDNKIIQQLGHYTINNNSIISSICNNLMHHKHQLLYPLQEVLMLLPQHPLHQQHLHNRKL